MAAIEILKSTLRTREYLDKGEVEGKSLLDAMRDGDTEGMQHFDGEIEKLIRAGFNRLRHRHGLLPRTRAICDCSSPTFSERPRTATGKSRAPGKGQAGDGNRARIAKRSRRKRRKILSPGRKPLEDFGSISFGPWRYLHENACISHDPFAVARNIS